MRNPRTPKEVSNNTITDIHYRLMETRNAVVKKRETQVPDNPEVTKITRRSVVSNMAERLSASVYRQLPADRKNHALQAKMRDTAVELLNEGVEVDAVAEKLHEMFVAP